MAAVKLGIEVYRPMAEGGRYDLIFGSRGPRLVRVQCKWAARRGGDVIIIRLPARVVAAPDGCF